MKDDVIRRQEALDAIFNIDLQIYEGNCAVGRRYYMTQEEVRSIINSLPSAQPEIPPYVAEIESEYKKWVNIRYINKPLAKALYEVWKKHDREDVSRNE